MPSLVPRPRRGGEKAAWYLLHAHARSTPTKPGAPNTTVYFPHFLPVYVSKLLRVIQMNYAIVSESTDWRVSYAPTDDASLAGQPLHKRGRVWYRAYMRVVPVLMQHLWIRYEDLAPDWPVCTLGIAPTNLVNV